MAFHKLIFIPRLRCGVYASVIGIEILITNFISLLKDFLNRQETVAHDFPENFSPCLTIYPSAKATFYAPSDPSETGGMQSECIRTVASWRGGPSHYDTVFIPSHNSQPGFRAFSIAHVLLFFFI
jgi:hypothetical protein